MGMVVVCGSFDDVRSRDLRFLEEAAKQGPLCVLLWSDEAVRAQTGCAPRFPEEERLYFVSAVRYVDKALLVGEAGGALPSVEGVNFSGWTVDAESDSEAKRDLCRRRGISYRVLSEEELGGFPPGPVEPPGLPGARKVIVTGCFDWLHSGHVRFFEEVSQLGELYVCVGHDANVRLLKGEGHPLFPEEERRYTAQSIRHVAYAMVSTGDGWMDAAPEIESIRPDTYAVNEDGDKPEKRAFCKAHGLEYVVLERAPREGLPRRTSTNLRGF